MKKIIRITIRIIAVIAAVLILAVIGLLAFFPVEKARLMAIEEGSEKLGRTVNIETAEISFWGGLGIQLGQVSISNPDGFEGEMFLTAENVDAKLNLLPLLTGDISVDRFILNKPTINLIKINDSINNYSFSTIEKSIPESPVKDVSPETKAAAAAVSFDKLELSKGKISYHDNLSGFWITAEGVDFSTRLENPNRGIYFSEGELKIERLIESTLEIPEVSLVFRYDSKFDYGRQRLELNNSNIKINDVDFMLNGYASKIFSQPQFTMNIKSSEVDLSKLRTIADKISENQFDKFDVDGEFELDLDLEYDHQQPDNMKYYGTVSLEDVNLSYLNIPGELTFKRALLDFKNDDLRLNIVEGTFDKRPISGNLAVTDFENPYLSGEFSGTLELEYLKPFIKTENEFTLGGSTRFDIKVSGYQKDLGNLEFTGRVEIDSGRVASDILLEPIEQFSLDLYFDQELTLINSFSAKSKSGQVDFKGRFNDLVPFLMSDSNSTDELVPTFEGDLSGNLDLAIISQLLPEKGQSRLSGRLDLDMSLTGRIDQLSYIKPRGRVKIVEAAYSDSLLPESIEFFEADLRVAADTIFVNQITTRFESSNAVFKGTLIKPFPYLLPLKDLNRSGMDKPYFIFELSSTKFDIDKLFPEAVPGSGESDVVEGLDSISFVVLPDIDGRGKFKIDTVIYSQVELHNVTGLASIKDKTIDCYDITAEVYGGTVFGTTLIDLNDFENPQYSGNFNASEVEANEFLSRFTPFDNVVYGKINLKGNYTASGWDAEHFLNSLTMNSDYIQTNGRLVTSGEIFSALSLIGDQFGETIDKEQTLKNLSTIISVKDGKVAVDQLKTRLGELGEIELSGFYSFDGGIDYEGSILLSKDYSKKLSKKLAGISSLFSEKSTKRFKLPLSFKGTIDKPEFDVNFYDDLLNSTTNDLGGKVKDIFNSIFKKK